MPQLDQMVNRERVVSSNEYRNCSSNDGNSDNTSWSCDFTAIIINSVSYLHLIFLHYLEIFVAFYNLILQHQMAEYDPTDLYSELHFVALYASLLYYYRYMKY
jgi:hypothetical protein